MKCHLFKHSDRLWWRDTRRSTGRFVVRALRILIAGLVSAAVLGCTSLPAPTSSLGQPPSIRIGHHTVSKGETLYSIAWRYGRDFRELAALNGIKPPYSIYPGQRLKLEGRAPRVAAAPRPRPAAKTAARPPARRAEPPPERKPVRSKSLTPRLVKHPTTTRTAASIRWQWPARGKVISRFAARDPLRKGVDIAGEKGDSVVAAADGTVIYAGSALRGYGKLLIVKHSEEFLSAYAHNHKLLVKEGSAVKAGQRIAELGSSGTSRNKLHFEIRRNGQPVDPMTYLP